MDAIQSPVARFNDVLIDDILVDRKVVFLEAGITVKDALIVLQQKRIISAPLVDLNKGAYAGHLDMFDVVTFILGIYPDIDSITPKALQSLEWAGKHFDETPVKEVVELSKQQSPFGSHIKPIHRGTLLPRLLDLFYLGVHRVSVVDSNNKIFNLVSQSDVMQYFAQNIHLIESKSQSSLEDLGIGSFNVQTITKDTVVIKALMLINSKRLSALPVIDEQGNLIANFSSSDLKGLKSEDLKDLLLPVWDYLVKRATPEEEYVCEKSLHPLSVKKGDTLEHAIYKVVATRVHRLWVIDNDKKPIGVVSLTDLMQVFLPYGKKNQEQ
eukprot:TRINITY_DN453_c0_g1_i1.p1 TRINITY_DN453_c0_g1~~TRINITY_DN453_c0_g1_i1.p1  ORF type:complete len:325 (+),score=71.44 TRINITY_DN453_c0_g1_i1:79-1053(+)